MATNWLLFSTMWFWALSIVFFLNFSHPVPTFSNFLILICHRFIPNFSATSSPEICCFNTNKSIILNNCPFISRWSQTPSLRLFLIFLTFPLSTLSFAESAICPQFNAQFISHNLDQEEFLLPFRWSDCGSEESFHYSCKWFLIAVPLSVPSPITQIIGS